MDTERVAEAQLLVDDLGLVGVTSGLNLLRLRDSLVAGDPWVVLVGAGLSADAGIPTWDTLARIVAEAVGHDAKIGGFASNALPTFFEECLDKATADGRASVFWDAVAEQVCQGDPGEVHDLLIQVPFEAYLTLNLDCLLTRRHSDLQGVEEPRVMVYPDLKPTKVGGRRLVHLHGACQDGNPRLDPDAVVLTESGYRDAYTNTPLDLLVQTVFNDFKVLALGTTFGDQQIEVLVQRVRDKEKERARTLGTAKPRTFSGFAMIANENDVPADSDEWSWLGKKVGLEAIAYRNPAKDHAAFVPLLGWLAKHTRRNETGTRYGDPDV